MNGGGNHVFPPLASVSPRLPIWADSSPHREAVAGMSSGRRAGGGGRLAHSRRSELRSGRSVLVLQVSASPAPGDACPCPPSPTPRSLPRLLHRNL